MNKHTPGPWRYEYETGYCGELIAAHGRCIASFIDEPSKHDASLIAAAPDLLEALRLIASAKTRGFDIDYVTGCANAAVAKATGREP